MVGYCWVAGKMRQKNFVLLLLALLSLVLLCGSAAARRCGECDACPGLWPRGETPPCVKVVFSGLGNCDLPDYYDYPDPPNGKAFYLPQAMILPAGCDTGDNCSWRITSSLWQKFQGRDLEDDDPVWSVYWEPYDCSSDGAVDCTTLILEGGPYEALHDNDPRTGLNPYFVTGYCHRPGSTPKCADSGISMTTRLLPPHMCKTGTAEISFDDIGWQCGANIDCDTTPLGTLFEICCNLWWDEFPEKKTDPDPCADRGGPVCNPGAVYVGTEPSKGKIEEIGDVIQGGTKNFTINLTGLSSPSGEATPADIMYILDRSGSMGETYTGSGGESKQKIEWAKEALDEVYGYIKGYDDSHPQNSFKVGLASFNHLSEVNAYLDYASESSFGYGRLHYPCGCTGIETSLVHASAVNFHDRDLSCWDDEVKKVVVLASDGAENRELFNDEHYSAFPGGPPVLFQDLLFTSIQNRYESIKNPEGNDPKITFYTIGIGAYGEWSGHLREIAYEWGDTEGAYYNIPTIDDLEDIYMEIADIYIDNRPASSALARIQLTGDFEYVDSTVFKKPAGSQEREPTGITPFYPAASGSATCGNGSIDAGEGEECEADSHCDGDEECFGCACVVKGRYEWSIPSIDEDENYSIELKVKAVGEEGKDVDVIKTADSHAWIYNKCGRQELDFGAIEADIVAPVINQRPVANAGPDQVVEPGVVVQLDGRGSYDPDGVLGCRDGDPNGTCLSYSWSCPAGNCPGLINSDNYQPTFTARNDGDVYDFGLIVDDGDLSSESDTVRVSVSQPPLGEEVLLIVSSSAEPTLLPAGENFESVAVGVKNRSNAQVKAKVRLVVWDALGTGETGVSIKSKGKGIGQGATEPFLKDDDFSNFEDSFDLSALEPGAYKLVAEAHRDEGGGSWVVDDTQFVVRFTILRPVPVPEMSGLLLPLIALSVLAIVFFAGKVLRSD